MCALPGALVLARAASETAQAEAEREKQEAAADQETEIEPGERQRAAALDVGLDPTLNAAVPIDDGGILREGSRSPHDNRGERGASQDD
jgi:hypothetical protein